VLESPCLFAFSKVESRIGRGWKGNVGSVGACGKMILSHCQAVTRGDETSTTPLWPLGTGQPTHSPWTVSTSMTHKDEAAITHAHDVALNNALAHQHSDSPWTTLDDDPGPFPRMLVVVDQLVPRRPYAYPYLSPLSHEPTPVIGSPTHIEQHASTSTSTYNKYAFAPTPPRPHWPEAYPLNETGSDSSM